MITFLRLVMLGILFLYSCLYAGSLIYSIRTFHFGQIPAIDWDMFAEGVAWTAIILVSVTLVLLTPFADWVRNLCMPTRKHSFREEQKVIPAVEQLRKLYRQKFGREIKIKPYSMDLPHINGITWGSKMVAVSTGLLQVVQQEELEGILAHEMGHLHYRDGIFNSIFGAASFTSVALTAVLLGAFIGSYGILLVAAIATIPLVLPFVAGSIPVLWLDSLLQETTRWPVEYRADRFATELGYGPALISLFEKLEIEDIRPKKGFLQKFSYSHPPMALRIDRIERILGVTEHKDDFTLMEEYGPGQMIAD